MNPNYFRIAMPVLFLPFKLKANTTSYVLICYSRQLFLPFKLKANTTNPVAIAICFRLFLPFKLKANTTSWCLGQLAGSCFCLSN